MAIEILDVNTHFGATPFHRTDSSAEVLVATLTREDVQWALTLSTYSLYHSDRAGNVETMTACANFERLIPVATLNPISYYGQEGPVEEVTSQPFEMFRFFPHVQDWPLDFAPFAALVARLTALRPIPIMISARQPGDATRLARILHEYPKQVILEGVGPQTLAECITVLRSEKHFYIETHSLRGPDSLRALRDVVGIDRILFGSGAPGKSLAAALRYIKRSDLSADDQAAVLGGNAQRLWHGGGE